MRRVRAGVQVTPEVDDRLRATFDLRIYCDQGDIDAQRAVWLDVWAVNSLPSVQVIVHRAGTDGASVRTVPPGLEAGVVIEPVYSGPVVPTAIPHMMRVEAVFDRAKVSPSAMGVAGVVALTPYDSPLETYTGTALVP